jgi:uncharacterized protein involved in exopolysaccharide biosynthesis/Mrp family chromosome partitioning ATPase
MIKMNNTEDTLSRSSIMDRYYKLDVVRFIRFSWLYKVRIFAFTIAGLMLAHFLVSKLAPIYESTSTLLIDVDQADITNITRVQDGQEFDKVTLLTEVQILSSALLLQKVATKLNLYSDPEFNVSLSEDHRENATPESFLDLVETWLSGPLDSAAEHSPAEKEQRVNQAILNTLQKKLTFSPVVGSKVVKITARADDPTTAALIANTISEQYILDKQLADRGQTQTASQFLETQISDLGSEVSTVEKAVEVLREQLSNDAGQSIENTERQMQLLNGSITNATVRAVELEAIYRQQSANLSSGNIDAILVDTEFFKARNRAEEAERIVIGLKNELDASNKEVAIIADKLRKLEEQSSYQRKRQLELTQLERKAVSARRLYETMLIRAQEIDAQKSLQPTFAQLISPAAIPISPNTTREKLIYVFAVVFGLVAAVGSALLQRAINSKVIDLEVLEHTFGYPLIGRLPKTNISSMEGLVTALYENRDSNFNDAMRRMRNRALQVIPAESSNGLVVMFTSSVANEGKTTSSLAFASVCQSIGLKTIVVDCDIRRANTELSELLTFKRHSLTDYLNGHCELTEVISRISNTEISVIQGIESKNYEREGGSDVLSSISMDLMIESLKHIFDVVILDVAPSVLFPDSEILVRYANAVIYVVKWGTTQIELVKHGISDLEKVDAPIAGFLVNSIDEKKASRLTHYQDLDYYRAKYI